MSHLYCSSPFGLDEEQYKWLLRLELEQDIFFSSSSSGPWWRSFLQVGSDQLDPHQWELMLQESRLAGGDLTFRPTRPLSPRQGRRTVSYETARRPKAEGWMAPLGMYACE